MFTYKISDMFKALYKTWYGWISTLLLVILISWCAWAFSAGNITLGVLLAVISLAYFLVLACLFFYVFILAAAGGFFLSVIFKGLLK